MYSISFSADQHYCSPIVAGVPTYEGAKQITALPLRLVNFYAFNKSASTVYLRITDSPDALTTIVPNRDWFVAIPAGSYVSGSVHGGDRMHKGLYVSPFTDTGLSVGAGSVLFYKFDWIADV